MIISFKPLKKSNFPLLLKWLETFHVKEWWDQDVSWTINSVTQKYSDYVDGFKTSTVNNIEVQKPIYAFIIHLNANPVGYIQYYNAYDFFRDDNELKDLPKSLAGLDIFIGKMDYLGKGIGSQSILLFLKEHIFKNFDYVIVDPETKNSSAISSYKKSGFKYAKNSVSRNIVLMLKPKQ